MATYSDMEELILLGAYRAGSSADVDEAIALHAPLEDSCPMQGRGDSLSDGYRRLEEIVAGQGAERA